MGRRPKQQDGEEEDEFSLDDLQAEDILVDGKFYKGNENILRTKNAVFKWTPEMQEDFKLCHKSILHFAEAHYTITHLDRGKEKISLYKYQKHLLKTFKKERFTILLSSRQSGKTTTMAIYALWYVCFQQDKRVTIISYKADSAKEIFARIKTAYEMLPIYLKPSIKSWRKDGLDLTNDSSITISTGPRGGSSNLLIIDEMAFCPPEDMAELWRSSIPIIIQSQKSQIILISTANGTDNKFYQLWQIAQKSDSMWHPERVDWWDVPGRDESWKADAVELLASEGRGQEDFDQEFGNQFITPGRSVVDPDLLEQLKNCPEPSMVLDEGKYLIYKMPEVGRHYVMGVDVGEGIGRSNTVAQVFDITNLQEIEQVAVYASNTISPYHFGTRLLGVLNDWGRPPVLIENNNNGNQVIDVVFHTHNYENLVSYTLEGNSVHYNTKNRKGIHSHTTTRYNGISNFRYWCNSLRAIKFYDPETIKELHTFVRLPNQTYSKQTKEDLDDRVFGCIWALFILNPSIVQNYFQIIDMDDQGRPKEMVSLYDNKDLLKQSPLLVGGSGLFRRNRVINTMPVMINPTPQNEQDNEARQLWNWLHTVAYNDRNIDPYKPAEPEFMTADALEGMYKEDYKPIILF